MAVENSNIKLVVSHQIHFSQKLGSNPLKRQKGAKKRRRYLE